MRMRGHFSLMAKPPNQWPQHPRTMFKFFVIHKVQVYFSFWRKLVSSILARFVPAKYVQCCRFVADDSLFRISTMIGLITLMCIIISALSW